jgi:hypothetical protein
MFVGTGAGCTCSPRKRRHLSRAKAPIHAAQLPSQQPLRGPIRGGALLGARRKQRARATVAACRKTGGNLSRMNTYAKVAANPFRMCTSKELDLNHCVMNTYRKWGEGRSYCYPAAISPPKPWTKVESSHFQSLPPSSWALLHKSENQLLCFHARAHDSVDMWGVAFPDYCYLNGCQAARKA